VKSKQRILFCLFLLVVIFLLSGCWDQVGIEKRAYVVAIGVDKGKNDDHIIVTYLIANPELSKQEGGSSEPSQEIITFAANDFITAKNTANSVIAKEISYNMLGVIIASEELARDSDFIRYMYDVTKDRELKRNLPLVISKEKASDFLTKNKPKLETRVHKYFEFILANGNDAGLIPRTQIHEFFEQTQDDDNLFLATYATTEETEDNKTFNGSEDSYKAGELDVEGQTNNTQFIGSAVFKEGKMIGTLNGEETRLAILLNEVLEMGEIYTTYTDPFQPQYKVSTRIMKREQNEVKMDLNQPTPTIDVTVPLYFDILSIHSMESYDYKKMKKLKSHIEEELTTKANNLVRKTQEEFKGEPFQWTLIARKHFWTIQEFENYDWMKSYPKMKVNIKVKAIIGTFGEQTKLPDLEEVRD